MNGHASEGHEDQVLEVLANADDPREGFAASQFANCKACQQFVEEVLATEHKFEALGTTERKRFGEYADQTQDVEVGRAEEAFAQMIRGETSTPSSGPARSAPWRALAAAAAILLVFALWQPWKQQAFDPTLGGELTRPIGTLEAHAGYGPFEWKPVKPARGWFRIRVRYTADGESREVVSPRIREQSWMPPAQMELQWPDKIEWSLEVFDGSGAPPATYSASAERSQ